MKVQNQKLGKLDYCIIVLIVAVPVIPESFMRLLELIIGNNQ